MKYSVIIPAYNAEHTIERCLDSLLNQPHDEAELLVINDGSTDGTGSICRSYADKYSCIRYFEQENKGVSVARNIGLTEAIGEYILFVDSDDYVSGGYFSTLDTVLESIDTELLLFGACHMGRKNKIWHTGSYNVGDKKRIARKINQAVRAYLFSNLWSKVFRRAVIVDNGLKFDRSLSIGEDQLFIFEYAMHISRMASISDVLYYFACDNRQSLSRKRRDYLTQQLLQVNLRMMDSLNGQMHADAVYRIHMESLVWSHYRSAYSACKELLKYDLSYADRKKRIGRICELYYIPIMKPNCIQNWVIAFPIIHKMEAVIEVLVRLSCRRM